jgi:hypothetical protein
MAEDIPSTPVAAASRATIVFERTVERAGDALWHRLRHRPYLGVALASAIGLTLASVVGVGEVGIAFLAGYAAFKALRQNEAPSKAFRDAARLGRDLGL